MYFHGANSLHGTALSRIVLPHMSCAKVAFFLTTWPDLGTIFYMRASALSEGFSEVVQEFVEQRRALSETFRFDLMKEVAHVYANLVKKGVPVESYGGS